MMKMVTSFEALDSEAKALQPVETPQGLISRERQLLLLVGLFNGGLDLIHCFGGRATVVIDSYEKQTNSRKRYAGLDYAPLPGYKPASHVGRLTRAWISRDGHPVLLIHDRNRQPSQEAISRAYMMGKNPPQPFTCVRVAGIRSIIPGGFEFA